MERTTTWLVALAASVGLTTTAEAQLPEASCYRVEELNVGEDLPTSWWGINDRGVLSGNFCVAPGCDPFIVEGVVYTPRRGGIFETFTSEPPAEFLAPYDINDRGVSVGTIFEPTTIGQVAFVRGRRGEITYLPAVVEDQLAAYAGGINNRGVVAGAAFTTAFEQVGFLAHPDRRGGWDIEIVEVEGVGPALYDINDRGDVVGFIPTDDGGFRGFLRSRRGHVTWIEVPGASRTLALGVNNRRQVVGIYADADGIERNFVYDRGAFSTLAIPDDLDSGAWGINDRGVIVGTFADAFRGFVAEPVRGRGCGRGPRR